MDAPAIQFAGWVGRGFSKTKSSYSGPKTVSCDLAILALLNPEHSIAKWEFNQRVRGGTRRMM